MAHETSEIIGFAIDNAGGTLTSISGDINNVTWRGGMTLNDDTGMGDSRRTRINGLASASQVTVNGWHNSTTRAIFLPLVDGTSVTKTLELKAASGDFWTGEVWPEDVTGLNVAVGGNSEFSVTFSAENGLTQTSVTAVP